MLPVSTEAAVRRGYIKKMFFKNFAKFIGKQIYLISFFDKVAGCNFIVKKETPMQMFSCEFFETFKNTSFTEHLQTTASIHTKNSFKTEQISHQEMLYVIYDLPISNILCEIT